MEALDGPERQNGRIPSYSMDLAMAEADSSCVLVTVSRRAFVMRVSRRRARGQRGTKNRDPRLDSSHFGDVH
jgi:hypothetical protein